LVVCFKGEINMNNYIVEVEDPKTDTLEAITEALNAFGIRCYVYEETKEKKTEDKKYKGEINT